MSSRLEQLKDLLQNDSNNSFLNYALSLEYNKEGKLEKAIAVLENLIAIDPDYLGAYYQLAKYHIQNVDAAKALNVLKKGVDVSIEQEDYKTKGEMEQLILEISQ